VVSAAKFRTRTAHKIKSGAGSVCGFNESGFSGSGQVGPVRVSVGEYVSITVLGVSWDFWGIDACGFGKYMRRCWFGFVGAKATNVGINFLRLRRDKLDNMIGKKFVVLNF
jgi:hypothetical protein